MTEDKLDLGLLNNSKTNVLPKAAIVQKTSKTLETGGKLGKIFITGTAENFDAVTVAPVAFKQTRMWFVGQGTSFFCRSDNAQYPINSESPNYKQQANTCAECPKSRWRGRSCPPPCSQVLEITFANLNENAVAPVFIMNFQRTAYKDALTLLKKMSDEGGASRNQVTIQSQRIDGTSFSYYIPLFEGVKPLSDANEAIVAPLREVYIRTTETPAAKPCEVSGPELIEIDLED